VVGKWVHINYVGGDPWVLPIWTAFNEGVKKGKFTPKTKEMSELAIHLSTRLNMIPWVINKVNTSWRVLINNIKNIEQKYVSTKSKQGYAYPLKDRITYNLLINIDGFLFEIDSCCELITTFIRMIYNHIGIEISEKQVGKKLKKIIEKEGKDVEWFNSLQEDRNIFIHKAAPYIAIDFTKAEKDSYDLLIMKENLKVFDNKDKFIRFLPHFNSISKGFTDSKNVLQKHVINLLTLRK